MPRNRISLRAALCVCASIAVSAPASAAANSLPDASISSPITVVPSMGGFVDGTATMSVSFTDMRATATASSPSIGLAAGHVFHVDTCIKAHDINPFHYDTSCQENTVDTTSNTGSISVAAPTATASMARPAAGSSGYFSFIVSVSEQQPNSNSFSAIASSWPSSGLTGASVGVPSVGDTTSPTPLSEGVTLTNNNNQTGGINTGFSDSFCQGRQYPTPSSLEDGVSTTAMGPGAPAYYEVGEPTGAYVGLPPKGIILIINGGGWSMNGPGMVASDRPDADYWRSAGWRTVNLTYRPCKQSFADVLWFYDQARAVWGSALPYCAMGASAGGNLALLLAAARSTVSCVVSEAGPTDGLTIKNESTPLGSTNGPRWVYNLLTAAVGPEQVVWWSPARFPIHARVLWAISAGDPYIPWAQGTELQSKMLAADPSAYVNLLQLASGTTNWVHAGISADATTAFQQAEQQLVAPLTG
jgi:acetyl esterase/lipase